MDNTAQPNIFAPVGGISTPPPSQPPPSYGGGRKWVTPRNIFIVLGIIVVVELVLSLRSIVKPSSTSTTSTPSTDGILNLPAVQQSNKGRITLVSDKKDVKSGDTISVSVEVNSPQLTSGVDVVAKFDSTLLSAIDGDIHQGTIFPLYPLLKLESGVVRISGIATPGSVGFSGKDIFAVVNFKALKSGVAKLTLDFTPGSTADSNIVGAESGKDLLEEVGNLEVVVR